jgi:CheY-like chemotaxis protein/MinD-like ATPase involved in chromosome partitioning or flagellar assembly
MKRILIVDDDPEICELVEFALQQAGFAVLIAEDGQKGLAMAREHQPDVAILDVMMPSMHGYELCRRLRADPRTTEAGIVILTARSQPIDEQAAMKAGADLFVAKPVVLSELVERVQALLHKVEQKAATAPLPRPKPKPAAKTEPIAKNGGRLVACLGPVPGTGVTTLAINLALAFAAWQRNAIPLVDVGGAPGSVLESLGIVSEGQQRGLSISDGELSWETLAPQLVAYRAGLHILPSPTTESVPPAVTHEAVSLLCKRFPLVIADAGHSLNARSTPVLLSADLILLVTNPEAHVMQALPGTLAALQEEGYPARQILSIVNNLEPKTRASIEELRSEITRPILSVIPYEPAIKYTQHTQRPLLAMNPRSPASQAIGQLTMQLARGLRLEKAAG